jgi:hypothetical protein
MEEPNKIESTTSPTTETVAIVDVPIEKKKKKVSYSQFSNWFNCPHRWYLDFVKGLRKTESSMSMSFGTAIHEAFQKYIEVMYKESVLKADQIELYPLFEESFKREIESGKLIPTPEELKEFMDDGDAIINAFKNVSNRMKHFPSNKYEFFGIEDEIIMPIKNNIDFICYIDVILKEKNTGRYKIFDIKTSRMGWNKYQKEDPSKVAQILLYKSFFSRKHNIPIDKIDVEFFIVKRKLYKDYPYPQSHIQTFVPKHATKNLVETINIFSQFVTDCFKSDGTFNETLDKYPKIPGKAKKNCKYCPHHKVTCDGKSDLSKEEME